MSPGNCSGSYSTLSNGRWKVEYEPEQFPGLIYRLDYPKVVCLIFGSGKMVITGARHKDEILEAVEIIKDELADLLEY